MMSLFVFLLLFPGYGYAQAPDCPLNGDGVNLGRVTAENELANVTDTPETAPQDHWFDHPTRERCVLFGCEILTVARQGPKWVVLQVGSNPGSCGFSTAEVANQCPGGARIAVLRAALTVAQGAATKRCAAERRKTDPAEIESRRQQRIQDRADALSEIRASQ
jgi:hypothetical protein